MYTLSRENKITDGQTERTDGRTDGRTNGQTPCKQYTLILCVAMCL